MIKHFKFLRNNNLLSPECYLPEYYDTTNRIFAYVSPVYYEPITFNEYKYMVYRDRYCGLATYKHRIGTTHPMYNYNLVR
jgi:hypothetical protein